MLGRPLALGLLLLVACGDDDGTLNRCEIVSDCAADERCVGGFCVAAPRDAGNDATRDTGVDAPGDAPSDTRIDVGAPDTTDSGAGGLTCPGPGGATEEPLVLYDFDGTDTPGMVRDQAPTLPDVPLMGRGDMTITEGYIDIVTGLLTATQGASDALAAAVVAEGSVTIEVWVQAADLILEETNPPERIFTLSQDTSSRIFTLGQDEMSFVGRFRTNNTNTSGSNCSIDAGPGPFDGGTPRGPASSIIADVFTDTSSLHHLVVVFDARLGIPRAFIDGAEVPMDYPCEMGVLEWPLGVHRLAIGDELMGTGARQWEGRMYRASIYARAWSAAEVTCWFEAGVAASVFR